MSCRHLIVRAAMLGSFFVAIPDGLSAQDDPSQRLLSLPDRELSELKQPQEFLKKLRSLMESKQQQPSESSNAPDSQPSRNPGQYEQLQNALQRLKEQLPPGFVPPDLSTIPPEQLKKTLENPAVQQQMRDLLKQFSEDGVLPPLGSKGGSRLKLPEAPLPGPPSSNQTPRSRRQDSRRADRSPGGQPPNEGSAVRKSEDSEHSEDSELGEGSEDSSPPVLPPESMRSLQDFLESLAGNTTQRPPTVRRRGNDFPPEQRRSENVPRDHLAPDPGRLRIDRPTPDESIPRGPSPGLRPKPMPGNPDDVGSSIPEPRLKVPAGELSPGESKVRSNETSEDAADVQQRSFKALRELLDQMTEPPQQQPNSSAVPEVAPRSGFSPLQRGDAGTPPKVPPTSQSPNARPPVPGTRAPDLLSTPPMDIRDELERNGFGGTIKKLVDKAKQQSRQQKSSGGEPRDPDGTGQTEGGASSGLEQSMIRMLDGMKDDLAEIAKDANFREPTRRNEPQRKNSASSSAAPQSESVLNRMRKSVSEFFPGPARTPQRNTQSGGPLAGMNPPTLDVQFDLTPVAVLAGLLAASAAAFFGLRFLKLRSADAMHAGATANPIAPHEIRNRADIVRAFHEFAIRSTKSVQSWWTHRAVERVMITASPEKRAAVETLANAYELARYLPQEVPLTSEQIQSARNALKECASGVQA